MKATKLKKESMLWMESGFLRRNQAERGTVPLED